MKHSLGHRHHPALSPRLPLEGVPHSGRKRWPKDTSILSSKRSVGWVWVQMGVSFCARRVSSNCLSDTLLTHCISSTSWTEIASVCYSDIFSRPVTNEPIFSRSLCREEDCHWGIAYLLGRYPPGGPLVGGITSSKHHNLSPLVARDHPVFLVRAESSCLIVCHVVESLITLTTFTVCSCNGLRVEGLSYALPCKPMHLTISSLDDFIDARLGRNCNSDTHQFGSSGPDVHQPEDIRSRSARIRAFRAQQAHKQGTPGPSRPPASLKAIHLLGADEVKSLFRDVTAGLAFLV
jgi:hypothetical protein